MPGETSLGAALLARLKNDTGSKLFIKLWTERGHRFDGNYYYPDNNHTSLTDRMTLEQAVAYLIKEDTDALDSKPDRTELSNVLAEEPLTPENFPDINTYTREDLKKDLFIDMWITRLSLYPDSQTRDIDGYDAATDEFIVNGLRFSYVDALMVDLCSAMVVGKPDELYNIVALPVKTLFWPYTSGEYILNLSYMFSGQSQLEILQIQTRFGARIFAGLIRNMFIGCTALKEIRGEIIPQYATVASDYANAFYGCVSLKEVRLQGIKVGISFADSPNLSLASISFMVTYAQNASPITITLHPTAYARVTDELFALAASKNITIASA